MQLISTAFPHEGNIPAKYTCDGDNVNPPLHISDVPVDAKSLVLFVEDPDVPKHLRVDGMWDHWVLFNLPPTTTTLAEGSEPLAIQGMTTYGKPGYGGPCPPDREHRYFFKLYALDITLDLSEGSTKQQVQQAMEGHVLTETTLMGRYKRPNV